MKVDAFGIILVCIAGVSLQGKKRRGVGETIQEIRQRGNLWKEMKLLLCHSVSENSGLEGTISATSSLHLWGKSIGCPL